MTLILLMVGLVGFMYLAKLGNMVFKAIERKVTEKRNIENAKVLRLPYSKSEYMTEEELNDIPVNDWELIVAEYKLIG